MRGGGGEDDIYGGFDVDVDSAAARSGPEGLTAAGLGTMASLGMLGAPAMPGALGTLRGYVPPPSPSLPPLHS
jgi:hypothetical protein